MKKIFFSSMFALFLFTSCENYLDVNEKQSNNANFDAIAPNQMLAGALNNYTNHQLNSLFPSVVVKTISLAERL